MEPWGKLRMKNTFYNTGYFLKEVKTMIRINLLYHVLSAISISLIFFILSMVLSGWGVSSHVVEVLQREAEISVYCDENIDNSTALKLVEQIKTVEGVQEARVVDENEAYGRMEEILGKDARVLEFFDENPFSSFIEVKISLVEMDNILEELQFMSGIETVRDNREVLERLNSILDMLKVLGCLVVVAVSISTIVIISHIIRMGIYSNREQINTLRLLGAPEGFIVAPFLIQGLMLTIIGGIVATILASFLIQYIYTKMAGPLPFIPLPSSKELVSNLATIVMLVSLSIGAVGSLLGFLSSRNR